MTSSVGSRAKKYHQIAESIRAEVRQAILRPGDRLPAESALASQHDTTVRTVRQALAVLRAEGLVESRHGIGNFVRVDQRLQRRSRSRYGEARGRAGLLNNAFRHRITSAGVEDLPEAIAKLTGDKPGIPVVVRRRELYDEHDQLQEVGASYLPVDFAAGTYLAEPAVVPMALFRCVEQITGRTYTRATDHWVARPATAEEADTFGLDIGTYLLHVTHVARDQDGELLEVSESTWPADRVVFVDEYEIPAAPTTDHPSSDV